eukprot:g2091.t1
MDFLAPEEERRTMVIGGSTYVLKKKLAEGGFSAIHIALHPRGGTVIRSEVRKVAQVEIALLKSLKHRNIVRLLDSSAYGSYVNLVLEYCQGGNLWDYVKRRQGVPIDEIILFKVFRDAVRALNFMHVHKPPIAHWDIKMDNILEAGDGSFKLCDFGSAQKAVVLCSPKEKLRRAEELIQRYTSPIYRAPEMIVILNNSIGVDRLTQKVDVWALGCVLYSLAYFVHPFAQSSNLGILGGKYKIPAVPNYSKAAKDCIRHCLEVDADTRASTSDVLERTDAIIEGRKANVKISRGKKGDSAEVMASTKISKDRKMTKTKKKKKKKKKKRSSLDDIFSNISLEEKSAASAPRRSSTSTSTASSHPAPPLPAAAAAAAGASSTERKSVWDDGDDFFSESVASDSSTQKEVWGAAGGVSFSTAGLKNEAKAASDEFEDWFD